MMEFKVAMFDFDGTITEKGSVAPSQEMADALVKLAQKMPIAFCTGRQLESFEDHGLAALLKEIDPHVAQSFLENLYLIAENGSIGYDFNTDLDRFEEFYRAKWPDELVKKDELKKLLKDPVKPFGELYCEAFPDRAHRVIVVITTRNCDIPRDERAIADTYALSTKIYEATIQVLEDISPDYEQYLHVGNAGIGVVICPANGDKDSGIKNFSQYLEKKRGIKFDEKFREVLVAGDSPQVGGNDHYFLNGTYGTPFTVGNFDKNKKTPSPVLDADGNRLLHDKGTLHLIKSVLKICAF